MSSRVGYQVNPRVFWRCYDRVHKGIELGWNEGLKSLLLNTSTVLGAETVTNYLAYSQFRFPKAPTLDDLSFIMIDPRKITHDFRSMPLPLRGPQAIVGVGSGYWDKSTIRFDDKPIVKAIRSRFEEGVEWEDTSFYQQAVWRVERGLPAWNDCSNKEDIDRRCHSVDVVYESIQSNGFRSQSELFLESQESQASKFTRRVSDFIVPDEIRLAIGRDGEVIRIAHGRHRLAIATILGVKEIPAIVQLTHADWEGTPDDLSTAPSGDYWIAPELVHQIVSSPK